MDVYFLRHGESLFNFNSQNDFIDCSLTLNGIEQSIQINHNNSFPKHYSLIICSPLSRCLQTLKYSNLTSDQLEIHHLFREIYSGCQSDLLDENEELMIENEELIEERIHQINHYLKKKKEDEEENLSNLLIVTHADLVWNLTAKTIDGELFGCWLDNGEIFHWKQI